jgi:serine phosphatase RsbU (regulator of sigma subunit)
MYILICIEGNNRYRRIISKAICVQIRQYVFIPFKHFTFSLQEDTDILKKEKLSENATLCVHLRRCEKNILKSAGEYAAQRKQKLQVVQETT